MVGSAYLPGPSSAFACSLLIDGHVLPRSGLGGGEAVVNLGHFDGSVRGGKIEVAKRKADCY